MFLVELVMQGVRGFRELARLRFQTGFNIVTASNESGKTTAADSMQCLLFPSEQKEHFHSLVSRQSPDASRAALVVYSDDNTYYRIIQDFSKRAVNLSKYNASNKEFGLLHKDWDNTITFMSGLTSDMSEQDYSRVFIFRREHYSALQQASSRQVPAPSAPAASRPVAPVNRQAPANQAKLVELRESLRKAEEAADADYKHQSAKLALDEIRKKLTSLDEIEEKKSGMEATLESLKGCAGLPENLTELIDEHERRQSQKLMESDEISKQIDGLKYQIAELPSANLVTDKLFIAGAALGVLSILAGVFLLTADQAMYFPLGILVSLMLMAGAWYNGARKNAQRKKVRREEEELVKELNDLERKFQHEGATILSYVRTTGSASTAELKEKTDNYRYFISLRSEVEEQRQRILSDQTPDTLKQQYEAQQQVVSELEQAARAIAHNNIDTYSIRQDIERLDSESKAATGDVSWDMGSEEPAFTGDFIPTAGAGGGFQAELAIASRIGGIEMETLVPAVEAAAQRNLATISAGKYVRIEAGSQGNPVVHLKDDSVVNYEEMSHGTRDLVYFCLRTGLVEALVGKRRLPFILDDPLKGFDPARQKAAGQVLRSLGTKTQVVLFTSNPALRAEGDAAAELK